MKILNQSSRVPDLLVTQNAGPPGTHTPTHMLGISGYVCAARPPGASPMADCLDGHSRGSGHAKSFHISVEDSLD